MAKREDPEQAREYTGARTHAHTVTCRTCSVAQDTVQAAADPYNVRMTQDCGDQECANSRGEDTKPVNPAG